MIYVILRIIEYNMFKCDVFLYIDRNFVLKIFLEILNGFILVDDIIYILYLK